MTSSKTDLSQTIAKLEREIATLNGEKKAIELKLEAKRYKLIDAVVDSAYKVIRLGRKKQSVTIRSKDTQNAKLGVAKNGGRSRRKVVAKKVDIINMNFFDWDGEVVYKGGAERYVYDLACLLNKMGYNARILQCSNKEFEKDFNGVKVVGIGAGDKSDMQICSAIYNEYCQDCEFVIASPLELASRIVDVPVIGINHGVNFDGEWNKYDKNHPCGYETYMKALKNVSRCVCVDTNFINWTRTQDYAMSLKEDYIPNYCNAEQFAKVAEGNKKRKNDDEVVFVYPRRIYSARGYDITIEAFEEILNEYKNKKTKIVLRFVGQVDNEEAGKRLAELMEKYPKNVFHEEYSMEEMAKAYDGADVVLIPTRYCEGTSLSCIEGMASGTMVVVTNVGGLPNLVIDGFNGRVISPTVEDLKAAAVEAIENPELRRKRAENGLKVAKEAFAKEKWENSWKMVLEKMR